jgi:LPXTG-motif cell wall-anchored protein
MQQTSSRAVRDGLKYISKDYGFLLRRGYEIHAVEDVEVGWQVVLRKADLLMKILHSRGDEYIDFRSATPPDEFTEMGIILSVITAEKISISLESPVNDLKKYLDQIESYFAGEYLRNPDALRVAREEYYASLPKPEWVLPVDPVRQKEAKRFPFLYYPLMAIVLLLLFIVLTTLYMILLDRLFSALSWDPDSYSMFMGVGAILLSIATLLLFRRRRQKS